MKVKLPEAVARLLLRAIEVVAARPEECARSPGRDFTRDRKLGLARLLLLLVTWGQDTAACELAKMCGWDGSAPSPPALTQQWRKLNDRAMPALLRAFLGMFGVVPHLGRYRLYAADGTELQLLPGTGGDRCRVPNGKGEGSHWEAHLTCAYDLVRRTFEDMVCQRGAEEDEPGALCRLVDRLFPGPGLVALWLADRNFCTYNVLCHMAEAGASFCVRASDRWVRNLLRDGLPAGEFDLLVERILVRTSRAALRSRPGEPWLYRVFWRNRRLDVLAPGAPGEYRLRLRVVRLRLPKGDGDGARGDKWLNLVTDLPEGEFPPEALAKLYARRWGVIPMSG